MRNVLDRVERGDDEIDVNWDVKVRVWEGVGGWLHFVQHITARFAHHFNLRCFTLQTRIGVWLRFLWPKKYTDIMRKRWKKETETEKEKES